MKLALGQEKQKFFPGIYLGERVDGDDELLANKVGNKVLLGWGDRAGLPKDSYFGHKTL